MSYAEAVSILWEADATRRVEFQNNPNLCLAYYTTADTALKIINDRTVWMRDSRLMNDTSEISYGQQVLNYSLSKKPAIGEFFHQLVSQSYPDLGYKLSSDYDKLSFLSKGTYLTCLGMHDLKRDFLGRLSMWRAYGQGNGVALLVNASAMSIEEDWAGVYSLPVNYLSPDHGAEYLEEKFQALASKSIDWSSLPEEDIREIISNFFGNFCISTKHPAFAEEREWRVYCRPNDESSPHVKKSIKTLSHVPQSILELDITPREKRLSSIIIGALVGPSSQQEIIGEALIDAFKTAGFQQPDEAVQLLPIPLLT